MSVNTPDESARIIGGGYNQQTSGSVFCGTQSSQEVQAQKANCLIKGLKITGGISTGLGIGDLVFVNVYTPPPSTNIDIGIAGIALSILGGGLAIIGPMLYYYAENISKKIYPNAVQISSDA